MPKIIFRPSKISPQQVEIEVPAGTSLLDAALECHVPMGHSCGGVCACSTCHVYIEKGGQNLSTQEDKEEDRLDMAFELRPSSRLGCQAEIQQGEVVVVLTPETIKAFLDENPKLRKELEAKEKAALNNISKADPDKDKEE
jgi:ferredoxin, 2Fe-2S